MNTNPTLLIILFLAICVATGCVHRSPGMLYKRNNEPLTEFQAPIRDEIRGDVFGLSEDIGPRSGSQSLSQVVAAETWITDRLRQAGIEPVRDVIDLGGFEVANLEVVFSGTELPDEIIVLGAHYDTVTDSPGANDNASGVAVLLAVARRLRGEPMARTVRLLFFVNEESPFTGGVQMGSRVYADRCKDRGDKIKLMISIDSIGYFVDAPGSQHFPALVSKLFPSTGNFVAFITSSEHEPVLDHVVAVFQEHARFPTIGVASGSKQINRSDHAPFLWRGYPALLMSDTSEGRDPAYHTPNDTPDRLNYDAVARVTSGLIRTVRTLTSAETALK